MIARVKPDWVMVELDPERAEKLINRTLHTLDGLGGSGGKDNKNESGGFGGFGLSDILKMVLGNAGGGMSGGITGANISKMLRSLYSQIAARGFDPGAEFRVAMHEARDRGVPVIFGDQNSHDTARNIASGLGGGLGAIGVVMRFVKLFTDPDARLKMAQFESELTRRMDQYNRENPHTRVRPNPHVKTVSTDVGGADLFGVPIDMIARFVEALKNRETARMMMYVVCVGCGCVRVLCCVLID